MNVAQLILFVLLVQSGLCTILLDQYPFFHSTETIHKRVAELSAQCALKMETEYFPLSNRSIGIDVVTLAQGRPNANNFRAFFLFGEHSRELISAESGLAFMNMMCQNHSVSTIPSCSPFPESFTIKIVLNANPVSRIRVEEGEFCLRTNENGVDLNRNWNAHWEKNSEFNTETYPGKYPFSEEETVIIKDQLISFKPHTFATIHSGSCAYLTPFAFSSVSPTKSVQSRWVKVLNHLETLGPHCPEGSASKVVGYSSPGTCLDYAFDVVHVPFPFGFEIYKLSDSPSILAVSNKNSLLLPSHNIKDMHDHTNMSLKIKNQKQLIRTHNSFLKKMNINHHLLKDTPVSVQHTLLQTVKQHPNGTSQISVSVKDRNIMNTNCFKEFNPITQNDYIKTINKWNENYLCLLSVTANMSTVKE